MRRILVGVLLVGSFTLPSAARPQVRAATGAPADSVARSRVEPLFTVRDALFAGGFAVGAVALWPLDVRIAEEVQDSVLQEVPWLRGAAGAFEFLGHPGALGVGGGIYAAGRLAGSRRVADVGLHTTESILLSEAVTFSLKSLAGRARPFVNIQQARNFDLLRGFANDTFQSFPSGHSTAAFATAAAITTELAELWPQRKPLIGGVLFSGATLVAVSRLYHNKHWASDVVVGAAIGSFGGWKVVRYNHTHPNNRLDRLLLSGMVVPDGRGGIVLAWTYPPGGPRTHPRR